MDHRFVSLPVLVVLCACAAAPAPRAPRAPIPVDTAPAATAAPASAPAPAIDSGPQDPVADSAPAARPAAPDLAIWRDPDFQRRFAESYLAETEIEPRLTADERAVMQEVMNLIAAEQVQQATKLLRDEGGAERSAVFDFTLGNLCFQQEQLEAAAAAYKLAVEKFPKFRRAHRNLGIIHVRQGNYAEAVRPLARVIELGGGDGVTYGLLGFAYGNIDNHLAAEFAYRQAYLLDPATLDWRLGLARSYFKQKRFAEAVSLCGNLIDEHPGRTDFWLLQANAYLGLQQPLAAAKNYEMVDKLGQSTTETLGMLGDIYINEELPELAVAAHLRALELDRAPTRALRAAKALVARNSLTATRTLLERIEALHGSRLAATERKELLKLRARLAVAEGAGDEEAKVLEEIVALDPLDGEALILLGQQKVRAGEPERAVFYFERAAGIEAFEADAKVRHAQLLVAQGRYDEALPMLRRAQALQPRDHIQSYLEQVERVAQARK